MYYFGILYPSHFFSKAAHIEFQKLLHELEESFPDFDILIGVRRRYLFSVYFEVLIKDCDLRSCLRPFPEAKKPKKYDKTRKSFQFIRWHGGQCLDEITEEKYNEMVSNATIRDS